MLKSGGGGGGEKDLRVAVYLVSWTPASLEPDGWPDALVDGLLIDGVANQGVRNLYYALLINQSLLFATNHTPGG